MKKILMKKSLKQILYSVKKNYLNLMIGILLLIFLINSFVTLWFVYNEKANTDQKIAERERIIIIRYNEQVKRYEKEIKEREFRWEFEKVALAPTALELQLQWDTELEKLRRIKNASFISLWLENFIENSIFVVIIVLPILIFIIVLVCFIRVLIRFSVYIKQFQRVYQEIQKMAVFQKYLIILVFSVLIVLILLR